MQGAEIDEAACAIASSQRVVAITGAGVSAESGVPTFRDAQSGLWANYRPEDLATPEAFARDPALVSRWYDERRWAVAACAPNAGHFALAELQRLLASDDREFTLLTQNVDRLHHRAGSTDVVELHGTLHVWRCTRSGERTEPPAPLPAYPAPSAAGGLLRPDVVWFGESLPEHAVLRAMESSSSCDVFLSIGTSSVVYPAAGFVDVARGAGATTIEVNPDRTPAAVDVRVTAPSGEAMPAIVERVRASLGA